MRLWKLLWKVPLALVGTAVGVVLLLVVAVGCVLYVPSLRQSVLDKALPVAEEQTGLDIDLGEIYLSPFHHSPMVLYRAYKGEEDLPLEIRIDSVFVGHRGQDTLLYARVLRLRAEIRSQKSEIRSQMSDFLARPIVVEHLQLDDATFHSDSMIAAVGIDALIGHLEATSPELIIAKGQYPLHGLRLYDATVGIDLRSKADTTEQDTTQTLMAFEVPDGEIRNLHFALTPMAMDVHADTMALNVLADVGGNRYDVRRLDIGRFGFGLGSLHVPADTIYGNACVDLGRKLITSSGLHVRSDEMGAEVDLQTTEMDLETMQVDVVGDAEYQGSKARLRAKYDIDDAIYDAHVEVERVNVSPFLKDSPPIVLAGEIDAAGKGIDPKSRAMKSKVNIHLTDAIYDNINVSGIRLNAELANGAVDGDLHLPVKSEIRSQKSDIRFEAETEHQFRVKEFMTIDKIGVDYSTQMRQVRAHVADEDFYVDSLDMHFTTADTTTLNLATEGLTADLSTPMHVLKLIDKIQPLLSAAGDSTVITPLTTLSDLTMLDTLRRLIPELTADIALTKGSPIQHIIERKGLDIEAIRLGLSSGSDQTDLTLDASIPTIEHPEDSTAIRLPAAKAAMRVQMQEGSTTASLNADSRLTDGAMALHNLQTDATLRFDLKRKGNDLNGTGRLTLDSLTLNEMHLGSRTVDMTVERSEAFTNALKADVQLDDIPLDIVSGILNMTDIDLHGMIRAQATADGLPGQLDLSAQVLPMKVSALYKPYNVQLGLGETPIVMNHNKVDFNGLPIYGADSTYLALTGGLDMNDMRLDISLAADSFAPVKLVKDGALPVYGDLATDIRGTVTGSLDSILADVDITILPTTDITYPIDKKNLAQVKPHGTVNVRYAMADSTPLNLGGRINVDEGFIRYSPKAYPIMPFHVDSGSHVTFNGSVGQTMLNISASQKVKADVESAGEETRRVDFRTGVRVNGVVDSIGLKTIGFFLEAPEDEQITHELETIDEETREGLAATLLATGMYVGESNVAAQRGGYALSSIVNSRLNAAMANSKMGKWIDIDLSSAQTEHAGGKSNDMNIAISKSFFKDRLRLTLGASISDDPQVLATNGLLNNLSAEYKLTKDGNVLLRAFGQRDFNNILEGELYKSGIGVRAKQEWKKKSEFRSQKSEIRDQKSDISSDSITRIYGLVADADVAWRSNNSLGPNLTLTHTIKNLMGKNETFTVKGTGAYYWALLDRHKGDPARTDTYKFGVNSSLVFPYLHWPGDNNPEGDTRYSVAYQYEHIAGGYNLHKVSGSLAYIIHSSQYITHAFTPLSVSVVRMTAESDSVYKKAEQNPQLYQLLSSGEFIPAIGYNFTYNDYRAKRAVNTMFDLGIKESGNLINGIYCLFGYKWNDRNKPLGSITFNQFVKLTAELRNKFNFTDKVCIATRLYAGANVPLGNSEMIPMSEAFYAGGTNYMRGMKPYSYGPGNFYSEKYNQNFFHAGDIKLEGNFELRFPIVWKLFGAAFVDAGNVWAWYNSGDELKKDFPDYIDVLQLRDEMYDGFLNNPYLLQQIALGTGAGLRLDIDGLVIRLDLGVGIHVPYKTYKYKYDEQKKWWIDDKSQPITTYFNIPSGWKALNLTFGIGYPF